MVYPTQTLGLKLVDLEGGTPTTFNFNIHKNTDGDGQSVRIRTIPWEPGMPVLPWVKDLFPFDAGVGRSKELNPRSYTLRSQLPVDAFYTDQIIPGPAVTAVTLTSAVSQCFKFIQAKDTAGTAIFGLSGRYLHRIDSAYTVVSTDLGAAVVATDLVQINGEVMISCGSTTFIKRRDAAGTITTSADTYATSMVIVRDRVWKVRNSNSAAPDNVLSYIVIPSTAGATAVNLMTLANWTTASPAYILGDNTYQCTMLYDNGGTLAGGRTDGIFMPDTEYKFLNVTPQIARAPDFSGETGKGCWSAFGYFWVPYHRGLLRLAPGFAEDVGPGTLYLQNVGLRVRTGLEWDRMMYILCSDERDGSLYLLKMVPDKQDLSDGEYIFHAVYYRSASTTHYGRAMTMFTAPTNPGLIFGGGAAATNAQRITLGRGSGRDVDDSNYTFQSSFCYLVSGLFTPLGKNENSMIATLVGAQVWAGQASGSNTISVQYDSTAGSIQPGANPTADMYREIGGVQATITSQGSHIRYAPVNTRGRFFNLRLTLDGSGTMAPTVLAWRAFGYMNPEVTHEISVLVDLRGAQSQLGNRRAAGISQSKAFDRLSQWCERGSVVSGTLDGYEDDLTNASNTLYFMVKDVDDTHEAISVAAGGRTDIEHLVKVTLVRVDYANQFGDAG